MGRARSASIALAVLATSCGARTGLDALLFGDDNGGPGGPSTLLDGGPDGAADASSDAPMDARADAMDASDSPNNPRPQMCEPDVCGGCAFQLGSPWPSYQRCPFHRGSTDAIGPRNPVILWTATSPNVGDWPPVYFGSAPVIAADGTIYVTLSDGEILAVDHAGHVRWNVAVEGWGWYAGSPTLSIARNGDLYVSVDQLEALDPADGHVRWSSPLGALATSPSQAISAAVGPDGTIFAAGFRGQQTGTSGVFALRSNGQEAWSDRTLDLQTSPAVGEDGALFVSDTLGRLFVFNGDGSQRWSASVGGSETQTWMTPTVGPDGTVYVGATNRVTTFYAFNGDGSTRWSIAFSNNYSASGTSALSPDGTSYFIGPHARLVAIDASGQLLWAVPTVDLEQSSPTNGPILDGAGVIYLNTESDFRVESTLYAVAPDGTVAWTVPLGGFANGPPALGADGTLYVATSTTLYAIGEAH
jgi:hypothetical protein